MLKFKSRMSQFFEDSDEFEKAERACSAFFENFPDSEVRMNTKDHCFFVYRQDMEESEELQTGVWYPASKFNGNPKRHALIERYSNGFINACNVNYILSSLATHFMLVERLGEDE